MPLLDIRRGACFPIHGDFIQHAHVRHFGTRGQGRDRADRRQVADDQPLSKHGQRPGGFKAIPASGDMLVHDRRHLPI